MSPYDKIRKPQRCGLDQAIFEQFAVAIFMLAIAARASRVGSLGISRSYATSNNPFRIALIPGDGIGKEVVPAAKEVLTAVIYLRLYFTIVSHLYLILDG